MGTEAVVLVAQVIEDLTFAPFRPGAFRAELRAARRQPLYKGDGVFVFTNVRSGAYRLRLSAERCSTEEHDVLIPQGPAPFESPPPLGAEHLYARPGDNELIVVVSSIAAATSRVTFAPEVVPLRIPAGAPVRGAGFAGRLLEPIEPGLAASARLDSTAGLLAGTVLRIVRGRSVRLRFSPYDELPDAASRVVGRVALAPDPSVAVADAEVRLLEVNGASITVVDVGGAAVATLVSGGVTTALGIERDVATRTNARGDFTLYSVRAPPWLSVRIRVRRAGFVDADVTAALAPGARNRVDVLLAPA